MLTARAASKACSAAYNGVMEMTDTNKLKETYSLYDKAVKKQVAGEYDDAVNLAQQSLEQSVGKSHWLYQLVENMQKQ